MDYDINQFGGRIAYALDVKDITQEEFSVMAGVTQQAVNSWIKGRARPRNPNMVADHLGVNIDWLNEGIGPMDKKKKDLVDKALDSVIARLEEAEKKMLLEIAQRFEKSKEKPDAE